MRCGPVSSAVIACAIAAGTAACGARPLAADDNIYYAGAAPFVVCSSNIDDIYHVTDGELEAALARARDDGTTLHLYTHVPGGTVSLDLLDYLLSTAAATGMSFVTYDALDAASGHGSLALSFDDHSVTEWTAIRPMLDQYHARVTFFVSLYLDMTDAEHAGLHQLAADGHAIEFHTRSHLDAVDYSAMHGTDAYVADEITPALDAMRADGFATTEFAYPFGARDDATDAALAPYFAHLRAIHSTCPRK